MSQIGSRKRPAPGASPVRQMQPPYQTRSAQSSNDQFLQWNQNSTANNLMSTSDPSDTNANMHNMRTSSLKREPSNQLARRPINQDIVARPQYNIDNENTSDSRNETPRRADEDWQNDDDELERRALIVKRSAEASRKSLPPFVQKLSSFIDESRNTDLIRWSSDGNSFIVLDEDRFAKTLLPELFKHDKYASFVRQLNMYGFHKKVGLSDNSMRASERRNKSPSEYFNPFFKRGKPNLLWLIQKPKTTTVKGRTVVKGEPTEWNRDDEADETYETENTVPGTPVTVDRANNLRNSRQALVIGQGEAALKREEFDSLKEELHAIRSQQAMITSMIRKVREDHDAMYNQAAAFQEIHNRHENSINAILTFLATYYSRSLEDHGQSLADLFPRKAQPQGSVVDMAELDGANVGHGAQNSALPHPPRRLPLLLEAARAVGNESEAGGRISAVSTPSVSGTTDGSPASPWHFGANATSSKHDAVVEVSDQSQPSDVHGRPNSQGRHEDTQTAEGNIMSLINSANANRGALVNRMDFPEALSHLQNADGQSPLSTNQRNNVLQLMASGNANATGSKGGSNNALTSPDPPNMPGPDLPQWKATKTHLELLERTLKEQNERVANVSNLLQPLSPSGSIPGLTDEHSYIPTGPADALDFDQLFDSSDYFNTTINDGGVDFGAGPADFNAASAFDFDNPSGEPGTNGLGLDGTDGSDDRTVESVNSSQSTSRATTAEDGAGDEEATGPHKRRRRE